MAEEIVFKTRVDTGNSAKDIDGINKSLKGVNQSAQATGRDSAKALEDLNKKIEAGGMTARQLNRALQEYQTIALEAGRTSPVGQEAIKNAANLQDQLTDLRNEITRTAHDGANMQAALQLGSTLVAGYGAAKGAMSMLGIESENLQETFVKLQAATATLNGLESIRAALEKESFLMMKARAVQTTVLTAATTAYNAVVGTTVGLTKALRVAMLAIPILAIIAGVVALIANFDKVVESIKNALRWLGIMDEESEKSVNHVAIARNKAVQKQIDDNKRLQESIGSTYDWEIQKAKAAGKDVSKLEREKRDEMRKTLLAQVDNLEQMMQLNRTNANEMLRQMQQIAAARATLLKLEREDELQTISEGAAARKQAQENKLNEAEEEKRLAQEKMERERLMRDFIIANIEDVNVRTLTAMQEKHERERDELIKKYGQDTELLKQLELKQFNELAEFEDGLRLTKEEQDLERENANRKAQLEGELIQMREDFEARQELVLELAELEREIALQNTELTEGEKFLIEQKYQQKKMDLLDENKQRAIAIESEIKDATTQIGQQAFNSISSLSDAFFDLKRSNLEEGSKEELAAAKKQFETNKKMQIGSAIISGVQGVINALTAQSVVPEPFGTILKAANAVAIGASTAENIAKIKNTTFQGGGGGGASVPGPASPSVGAPSVPSEFTRGGDSTLTDGLPSNGDTTQTAKVVIVDSDIKAGLDNNQKVTAVSSIG